MTAEKGKKKENKWQFHTWAISLKHIISVKNFLRGENYIESWSYQEDKLKE